MSFSNKFFYPFEKFGAPFENNNASFLFSTPSHLLIHCVKKFRYSILLMVIFGVTVEVINLTMIWGFSNIVDGIAISSPREYLNQNKQFLIGLAVLLFPILPICNFISNAFNSQVISVCLPAALQWIGHKAVERQDIEYFQTLYTGQVASRISQMAFAVQQQVAIAFQAIPVYLIQFVGSVMLIFTLSWELAIPVIIWIILNISITVFAIPEFAARSKKSASARSSIFGCMTDIYKNIKLVKLFSHEREETEKLQRVISESIMTQQKERRLFVTMDFLMTTLVVVLWLSVFSVGLWGLIDDFTTEGQFVACIYVVQRLTGSMNAILQMSQQIFQAFGIISDALPMISQRPKVFEKHDAEELIVDGGEIVFENVSFGYNSQSKIFDNFSLTVKAGEKVGIVGSSGAGKSTLLNLLLRFYDVEEGQITIDDQDIRGVTNKSLKKEIGVITQDVMLFHRTIGENIGLGDSKAESLELMEAAKLAEAHEFISSFNDGNGGAGYDAIVGDGGVKLSGGQRQKISIARVLLKNPPIMLLDEATSALDIQSELKLQKQLDTLMKGKTVIAIAHRLSTLNKMDRIIVVEDGKIVCSGTPNEVFSNQASCTSSNGF